MTAPELLMQTTAHGIIQAVLEISNKHANALQKLVGEIYWFQASSLDLRTLTSTNQTFTILRLYRRSWFFATWLRLGLGRLGPLKESPDHTLQVTVLC